ncbi:hypothetical protein C7271_01755 [filamentous cyanobacterium CCP5]|nr:hypothetical protein C7271_01755 [filamentous cyanobacterium CCP5]
MIDLAHRPTQSLYPWASKSIYMTLTEQQHSDISMKKMFEVNNFRVISAIADHNRSQWKCD